MPVTINGSNTPTAGGVTYGDGTTYANTAAGTSGQLLQSNGASAPTWVAAPSTSPAGSTGQVQYNNAGAFGAISSGTSGQVLTSGGSGAAPTWTSPSAGALVFISSQTVSGTPSTVSFTSGITSTYDDYVIIYENVLCNTTFSEIAIRLYKSGSFQTSGYMWNFTEFSTSNSGSSSISSDRIQFNSGNTTANVTRHSGRVNLFSVNTATANAALVFGQGMGTGAAAAANYVSSGGGSQSTAAVVTGIQFYWGSGGNFTSGTYRLYGIAKS